MGIDVYLQIDGIRGESGDAWHPAWIEVAQAHWGVARPGPGGGPGGLGRHRSLWLAKPADLASPLLMQCCTSGKTLRAAKLEMMRADADGRRVKYYEVELENVLVARMAQTVAEGRGVRDHITLHFTKVTWTYSQPGIGAGLGGQSAGALDLSGG